MFPLHSIQVPFPLVVSPLTFDLTKCPCFIIQHEPVASSSKKTPAAFSCITVSGTSLVIQVASYLLTHIQVVNGSCYFLARN